MKKIADEIDICYDNFYIVDDKLQYFDISPRKKGKRLYAYSRDNVRRTSDMTVLFVSTPWIKSFIKGKKIKLKFKYKFPELFASGLPKGLFKELFNTDQFTIANITTPNERVLVCHKPHESYYLFINNRMIVAMVSRDGENIQVPIPEHWKIQFAEYHYLCNHKYINV